MNSTSGFSNPMAISQTHFQNAHHFQVNGGNFINVNTTILNNATDFDSVTLVLRQYVATASIFDSAERYPPGRCHPGTRQRIIKQITDWIDDPDTTQSIIWLYGPAGSGKSAIAQSICEHLAQSHSERFGASFFFVRTLTDRRDAHKLFTTISYQLALRFPSFRSEINKLLTHDPTLPSKSMEIQLESLIVQPLLQCQDPPPHSPIIIIDALDECADDQGPSTQRDIISLIAKSVVKYNLPLRFLVASRPEYWIRDAFDISPLPTITKSLSLRDEFDADEDIRTYLTDEFERIRVENKRLMGSVKLPWPPKEVVDCLVYEASGQFVYASTVIRFVGKFSTFSNPQEQLRIITSSGPHRALAFSELDRLYSTILSKYPRWESMKRVLGGLLVYPSTLIAKVFLGVDPDELVLVMDALSSLLDTSVFKEHSFRLFLQLFNPLATQSATLAKVVFCHLSFREFLENEIRSGMFYIKVDDFRDEITRAIFIMIHQDLDLGYGTARHLTFNIDLATYHWFIYNVASQSLQGSRIDTLVPLITHMTERIVPPIHFDPGMPMESLAGFLEDMRLLECITTNLLNLRPVLDSQALSGQRRIEESPENIRRIVCARFQDAVSLAQKRALCALTQCNDFKVTPVLVYMAEFHRYKPWISVETLSSISGTTDVISTIKQHRYIFDFSDFFSKADSELRLRVADLKALFEYEDLDSLFAIEDARISDILHSDEWKEQRIFVVCHLLNLNSLSGSNMAHFNLTYYEQCIILKTKFFDLRSITNICGMKNTRNACKCWSFLKFICDFHMPEQAMYHLVNLQFIASMICWLNRQLTNPRPLKLLLDHHETLPMRMAVTMKRIFQEYFIPEFTASSHRTFYTKGSLLEPWNFTAWSTPTAKSLPLGTLDFRIFDCQDWGHEHPYWNIFHDEVFGKNDGSTASIIDPLCWYPHLASRLLNILVRLLYREAHPRPSWDQSFRDKSKLKGILSYMTPSLPMAEPTLDNLEALRLVVYFYPKVADIDTVSSILPEDIWLSIASFLQRYPRSILSSEELDLLDKWLYSPDHLDISNYLLT